VPSFSASFAIAASALDHPCAGRRTYDMLVLCYLPCGVREQE
jgi:hypothetical protein